jgi:hypothetical protein
MALRFRNLAGFGITGQTNRELSFNVRYGTPLQARSERGGRSPSSGATRAPDAVNEIFGDLGQIVVHHVRDAIYVDAAGGDVGCHQNAIRASLKAAKSLDALVPAAVAMNGSGLDSPVGQPSSQPLRAMLCPGEYEKRTFVLLQKAMEKREFLVLLHFVQPEIDLVGALRRGTDFNSSTTGDVSVHQATDRGQGRRNEERFTLSAQRPTGLPSVEREYQGSA